MNADSGCRILGWAEAETLFAGTLGIAPVELARFDSPHYLERSRIASWEKLSDHAIFRRLEAPSSLLGTVGVVSELSYARDLGVFLVEGRFLNDFVDGYLDRYGECLFSGGDTFFIFSQENLLLFFHHSGFIFRYRLPL